MNRNGKNGQGGVSPRAEIVAVSEEPARVIGEAVGLLAATLARALPDLAEADGKRLCRQMMAVVKAEADALG